jgi:hypothetical protein
MIHTAQFSDSCFIVRNNPHHVEIYHQRYRKGKRDYQVKNAEHHSRFHEQQIVEIQSGPNFGDESKLKPQQNRENYIIFRHFIFSIVVYICIKILLDSRCL